MTKKKFIPVRQILDVHCRELTIGNSDKGTIEGSDAGGAKTDTFHGSLDVARLAEVAHPDGLISDDHNSAEEILDRLL